MDDYLLLQQIIPEFAFQLKRRYDLLNVVQGLEPIGRRNLAKEIGLTERVIRNELGVLKKSGLVYQTKQGICLTKQGNYLWEALGSRLAKWVAMLPLEEALAERLALPYCRIAQSDPKSKDNHAANVADLVSEVLDFHLPYGDNIIAVAGGTTMANLAAELDETISRQRNILFVPARGGVGESSLIQANSVSDHLAKRLHSRNLPMYVPEHVSHATYALLMKEPSVADALAKLKQATCLIYSIGEAIPMARRRHMSDDVLDLLSKKKAVGEAFGCFFNQAGEVVYQIPRIGIHLEDLAHIPLVIALVVGRQKAQATEAFMKLASPNTWLVTDDALAQLILSGETR